MGVAVIMQSEESAPLYLEWINETQWFQRNGDAITNLNLLLRLQEVPPCEDNPRPTELTLIVAAEIADLWEISRHWLQEPNVTYYSNTSGEFFRITDVENRTITDARGEIFVNQADLLTETETLPKGRNNRPRHLTYIHITLQHDLQDPSQRHMIQFQFTAKHVAFRRSVQRHMFGSNWYFVNRYYSVYDLWNHTTRALSIDLSGKRIVPVDVIENWIALPGFARSAEFFPDPDLRSIITIDHPGYMESLLRIRSQLIARFTLVTAHATNPWFSKHVFGEYESQPLPAWMAQVAFWIGVVALILTIVALIFGG